MEKLRNSSKYPLPILASPLIVSRVGDIEELRTTETRLMATRFKQKERKGEPKLSVFADLDLLKKIQHEKVDTGLTIAEIVNERLAISYRSQPKLKARREAVAAI